MPRVGSAAKIYPEEAMAGKSVKTHSKSKRKKNSVLLTIREIKIYIVIYCNYLNQLFTCLYSIVVCQYFRVCCCLGTVYAL